MNRKVPVRFGGGVTRYPSSRRKHAPYPIRLDESEVPRWRSGRCPGGQAEVRILAITVGSRRAAMIVKEPPHWGHCSLSIANTRLSSRAQLMWAGAE